MTQASQVVETASEMSVDDAASALMDKWEADSTEEVTEVTAEAETEEEVEVEATESDEDSDESDVQEPESEEEALDFQSIQDLAEALDITPEQFLEKIKGKVKVDGEESEISLSEALNGYQRQADYQRKTAELAEQRKQVEQIITQQQAELAQRNQIAQASLQAAENVLMQEFQGINWQELETVDPGQAALMRQKFQNRHAEIQHYQSQLVQQQQYEAQQAQAYQAQALEKFVAQQKEALSKVAPDWTADTSKSVAAYLTNHGFTPDEVGQLVDHRQALIAHKAMLYDQGQKSVEVAKRKVKDVPKMLKPGNKNKTKNQERVSTLKSRLKKSGSVQDAAALLLERMG